MKRSVLVSLLMAGIWSLPVDAEPGRLILRVAGGLPLAQTVCLLAGCTVTKNIDGAVGQLYLVTVPNSANLHPSLTTLSRLLGVIDVEIDQLAKVSDSGSSIPAALADKTPVDYFGTMVPHGYVSQPATEKIRLADAQAAFPGVTGSGVVAVIDTGVDPNHPALQNVLLPGYDFTRNRNGADETLDVSLNQQPVVAGVAPTWVSGDGNGDVSQSTAAVVDQSTAAVVDGNPQYSDFGHGTMVAGLIHLIAPTAHILPLKAFRADGTGYTSDILRAIYSGILAHANVFNMSFNIAGYSQELTNALNLATLTGTISIAAAGNSGSRTTVYPAALPNVIGVASTTNNDQISAFSNYGSALVWVAAPGEAVVTTYPFGTYAAGWGTSFSTPLAAGVAALLLDVNPLCDQYSNAQSVAHAQPISPDAGHGRLDIFQAVGFWHHAVNP